MATFRTIIAWDFSKDGFEFSMHSDKENNSLILHTIGKQSVNINTLGSNWLNNTMDTLHRFDSDCVLDKNDEMVIKGKLLSLVSREAQISGFNIIL